MIRNNNETTRIRKIVAPDLANQNRLHYLKSASGETNTVRTSLVVKQTEKGADISRGKTQPKFPGQDRLHYLKLAFGETKKQRHSSGNAI